MKNNPRSRDATKQETRAALIQAGLLEFFERGLDVPSLDAICARAGFTRGAFYVHFRDRDEFVVAVMDTVLGAFLDVIIATDSADADLAQTILRFASALIDGNSLLGEQGEMRLHQLLDACARSEPIRRQIIATIGEGIRRVERAATNGQVAKTVRGDVESAPLAAVLVALALGLLQMFEFGMKLELQEIRATVLRLVGPTGSTRRKT